MTSRVESVYAGADPRPEETGRAASLTDDLYAKLERQILSGDIGPGARLPTQREIALEHNVSRTVVREAVARLSAQGLTVSRQGSGVFVADTAGYRAFQITADEVSELSDVIKLLEIRLGVETEMAGLAASRRTTADIGAIQSALQEMMRHGDDAVAAAHADRAFHMAIASATKNEYYERFVQFLGVRLVPSRDLYIREQSIDLHRAYAAKVLGEHEAIVDAIIRMDPARAREAARQHMHESLTRHSSLSVTVASKEKAG